MVIPGYILNLAWWDRYGVIVMSFVFHIAIIIAAYFVIRTVVFQLIDRCVQLPGEAAASDARRARVGALRTVLRSAAGFTLGFIAVIMLLQAVGINVSSLISAATILGLAIGFGAQKLVKDVISGFFILSEDQYGVGDYVTIGTTSGVVRELGMRTTRLIDNSGKIFIISNGDIVSVYNHSRNPLTAWLDVPLSASTDLEKAKSVLDSLGAIIADEMPDKIKTPFKSDGLATIAADKIAVRFAGGVVARYQEEVILALNERIRSEFVANGIGLG